MLDVAVADEWKCIDYASDTKQLVHLEAEATRGALLRRDLDCLENGFANTSVMTTKDKISRVLLVNAYAKDTKVWAQLVERHLQEVDQSDPDIAYLYSYYLYNQKEKDLDAIIEWTEVGLDRKQEWKGTIHVNRVISLLRLRSLAANDIYINLAKQNSETNEDQDTLFKARNRTKTVTREWMDYAKASERNFQEAFDLCITVATQKACLADQLDSTTTGESSK
jgi:hypothetical protein